GRLAFARQVERLLGRRLHPRGQFVAGDAGVEVQLAGVGGEMIAIETIEIRQVAFLRLALQVRLRVEVLDARLRRPDPPALVQRGKPAVGPVADAYDRQRAGVGQGDVGRQFATLRAQGVGQPTAQHRPAGEDRPGVERVDRLHVVVDAGVHRADDANVVND